MDYFEVDPGTPFRISVSRTLKEPAVSPNESLRKFIQGESEAERLVLRGTLTRSSSLDGLKDRKSFPPLPEAIIYAGKVDRYIAERFPRDDIQNALVRIAEHLKDLLDCGGKGYFDESGGPFKDQTYVIRLGARRYDGLDPSVPDAKGFNEWRIWDD